MSCCWTDALKLQSDDRTPEPDRRSGSNELVRIEFGSESKMPEGVYIRTSGGPAVKVVSKDVFDKFNIKAEDLVEPEKPEGEKPKS